MCSRFMAVYVSVRKEEAKTKETKSIFEFTYLGKS